MYIVIIIISVYKYIAYIGFFQISVLKGIKDFCLCRFCKMFLLFWTKVVTEMIINLILGEFFL